ncbi:hypothetical protein Daura_10670 [Dactylosporangium aurantiacum]|uniref:Uncharacterized protein n=1 Tax=Dactylosporangium aurantiacum TaxID=35754 RepID=A0A9Q9II39_9ACTN|nr:hypothetical protein [Dactylosporangium aurantiacum]MDG6109196.1 hypothetical protein [Dactylosporangium aurantiacum]UWZ56594.1 hypothetical protein Daura_10670 [Dactylosporangium aurantiacum]
MSWSLTTLLAAWSSVTSPADAVAMATAVLAALAIVLAARLLTGAPTAAPRVVPVPARARSRWARPSRATDPDAAGRPRPRAPGRR